jgi:hypothetical protein
MGGAPISVRLSRRRFGVEQMRWRAAVEDHDPASEGIIADEIQGARGQCF